MEAEKEVEILRDVAAKLYSALYDLHIDYGYDPCRKHKCSLQESVEWLEKQVLEHVREKHYFKTKDMVFSDYEKAYKKFNKVKASFEAITFASKELAKIDRERQVGKTTEENGWE